MKIQHPDVRRIMAQTDNGKQIFEHYKVPIDTMITSPLNKYDSRCTFKVAYCDDSRKYKFTDSSSSTLYREGDAIDFIMKLNYMSFRNAVQKIVTDLKLK